VLRDVEDLQYEDIATLLGVLVGTVKSRVFRARQLLAIAPGAKEFAKSSHSRKLTHCQADELRFAE
jgi:DNA-directed RNA polymerase specialized sigma24 family protein